MEKQDFDFNVIKSLLRNKFIVREWLEKKGYYLDLDKHESMTNKYYDGVL